MALVTGMVGSAEARRGGGIVVINTGDAIEHVRDLDSDAARELGYSKLGFRYTRFGLFWLDLWRWDGEFVVYEGSTYVPITDDELETLGGAWVPLRYHLPEGLLIIVAGIYLLVVGRRKRKVKTTWIIAGVLAATAVVFLLFGLTWEFMIPLGIAIHHALSARAAMNRGETDDATEDTTDEVATTETPRDSTPAPRTVARSSGPIGTPPPLSTPSAEPRPSQPLVIERAPTAPAVVPMREDHSVDGPKLLR